MPLRDHFLRPKRHWVNWDGVFGGWPAMCAVALHEVLPAGYASGPYVRHDAYEGVEGDWPDTDEYQVRVSEPQSWRALRTVVHFVSPANKRTPSRRRAFAAQCAVQLQQQLAVAIVDVVGEPAGNLYRELLDFIGQPELSRTADAPLYAVACRFKDEYVRGYVRQWRFEAWEKPLEIGEPLPTLPLWIDYDLTVPLDLEASYEETCRIVRVV